MGKTLNPEHLGYDLLQNEIQREWMKKHIKTQKPKAKTMNLSCACKIGSRTFRLLPSPCDNIWPWESNYLKIHSKTKRAVPYLKAHTVGLNYQHDEIDIILITTALKHCSKQLLMLKSLPSQSININDCIFQGYSSTENQKHLGWQDTCFSNIILKVSCYLLCGYNGCGKTVDRL